MNRYPHNDIEPIDKEELIINGILTEFEDSLDKAMSKALYEYCREKKEYSGLISQIDEFKLSLRR